MVTACIQTITHMCVVHVTRNVTDVYTFAQQAIISGWTTQV
jgi:hypothetical protein